MYNTRSRGRVVLTGSARSHRRLRVSIPSADLTTSQALDILESEEMVPDTEMSYSGHEVTSECNENDDHDDDKAIIGTECELSSPRESFQREGDDDDDIPQISNNKISLSPQPHSGNLIRVFTF